MTYSIKFSPWSDHQLDGSTCGKLITFHTLKAGISISDFVEHFANLQSAEY